MRRRDEQPTAPADEVEAGPLDRWLEDDEPVVEDLNTDDNEAAGPVDASVEVEDVVAAPRSTVARTWDPRAGAWVGSSQQTVVKKRDRSRPAWMFPALAGAIAGAIVAAAVAVPVARLTSQDGTTAVERRVADPLPQGESGSGATIVDIASRARPSVVNINVGTRQSTVFGDLQLSGTGSGVILRSDGHIVTNAHVVEGASAIEVTLASGDKIDAKLVGADVETDIAVLKIDRNDLPAAVIGSVKDIQVGQTAVAIGSPLGLEQTVTSGIISALGRRVDRQSLPPLVDMIQTDAPVTQGNSGGALLDGRGSLIGINAAIAASPEVGAEGIAFAIPVDVAVAVAEELINSGKATHPWLGITGANITPEAAQEFGVEQGAFIREVVGGGPAERAGIRPNDIVVSFADQEIKSMDDLVVAIRQHRVGEQVTVIVVRDGERLTLKATLGDKPANL